VLYEDLRNGKDYITEGVIESVKKSVKHVCSGAAVMARFNKGFPSERHLLFFGEYRYPGTGYPKNFFT